MLGRDHTDCELQHTKFYLSKQKGQTRKSFIKLKKDVEKEVGQSKNNWFENATVRKMRETEGDMNVLQSPKTLTVCMSSLTPATYRHYDAENTPECSVPQTFRRLLNSQCTPSQSPSFAWMPLSLGLSPVTDEKTKLAGNLDMPQLSQEDLVMSLGINLDDSAVTWTSSLATPTVTDPNKTENLHAVELSPQESTKQKGLPRVLFSPGPTDSNDESGFYLDNTTDESKQNITMGTTEIKANLSSNVEQNVERKSNTVEALSDAMIKTESVDIDQNSMPLFSQDLYENIQNENLVQDTQTVRGHSTVNNETEKSESDKAFRYKNKKRASQESSKEHVRLENVSTKEDVVTNTLSDFFDPPSKSAGRRRCAPGRGKKRKLEYDSPLLEFKVEEGFCSTPVEPQKIIKSILTGERKRRKSESTEKAERCRKRVRFFEKEDNVKEFQSENKNLIDNIQQTEPIVSNYIQQTEPIVSNYIQQTEPIVSNYIQQTEPIVSGASECHKIKEEPPSAIDIKQESITCNKSPQEVEEIDDFSVQFSPSAIEEMCCETSIENPDSLSPVLGSTHRVLERYSQGIDKDCVNKDHLQINNKCNKEQLQSECGGDISNSQTAESTKQVSDGQSNDTDNSRYRGSGAAMNVNDDHSLIATKNTASEASTNKSDSEKAAQETSKSAANCISVSLKGKPKKFMYPTKRQIKTTCPKTVFGFLDNNEMVMEKSGPAKNLTASSNSLSASSISPGGKSPLVENERQSSKKDNYSPVGKSPYKSVAGFERFSSRYGTEVADTNKKSEKSRHFTVSEPDSPSVTKAKLVPDHTIMTVSPKTDKTIATATCQLSDDDFFDECDLDFVDLPDVNCTIPTSVQDKQEAKEQINDKAWCAVDKAGKDKFPIVTVNQYQSAVDIKTGSIAGDKGHSNGTVSDIRNGLYMSNLKGNETSTSMETTKMEKEQEKVIVATTDTKQMSDRIDHVKCSVSIDAESNNKKSGNHSSPLPDDKTLKSSTCYGSSYQPDMTLCKSMDLSHANNQHILDSMGDREDTGTDKTDNIQSYSNDIKNCNAILAKDKSKSGKNKGEENKNFTNLQSNTYVKRNVTELPKNKMSPYPIATERDCKYLQPKSPEATSVKTEVKTGAEHCDKSHNTLFTIGANETNVKSVDINQQHPPPSVSESWQELDCFRSKIELESENRGVVSKKNFSQFSDNKTGTGESSSICKFAGFQTAAGRTLSLSDVALKNAKVLMEDSESNKNSVSSYHIPQQSDKSERNFIGFQTAGGKAVGLTDAALQKAKIMMEECDNTSRDEGALAGDLHLHLEVDIRHNSEVQDKLSKSHTESKSKGPDTYGHNDKPGSAKTVMKASHQNVKEQMTNKKSSTIHVGMISKPESAASKKMKTNIFADIFEEFGNCESGNSHSDFKSEGFQTARGNLLGFEIAGGDNLGFQSALGSKMGFKTAAGGGDMGFQKAGVNSTWLQTAGENSTGFQPAGVNSTGFQPAGDSEVNSTGFQPAGVNSTGFQPAGVNSTGFQPAGDSGVNSTGFQPAGVNSTGFQPAGVNSTGFQPAGDSEVNSTGFQPAGVNSTGFQPAGDSEVNSTGFQPAGVNSTGFQPAGDSGVNSTGFQPAGVNSTGFQPAGVNSTGFQPAGVNNTGFQPAGGGDMSSSHTDVKKESQTNLHTESESKSSISKYNIDVNDLTDVQDSEELIAQAMFSGVKSMKLNTKSSFNRTDMKRAHNAGQQMKSNTIASKFPPGSNVPKGFRPFKPPKIMKKATVESKTVSSETDTSKSTVSIAHPVENANKDKKLDMSGELDKSLMNEMFQDEMDDTQMFSPGSLKSMKDSNADNSVRVGTEKCQSNGCREEEKKHLIVKDTSDEAQERPRLSTVENELSTKTFHDISDTNSATGTVNDQGITCINHAEYKCKKSEAVNKSIGNTGAATKNPTSGVRSGGDSKPRGLSDSDTNEQLMDLSEMTEECFHGTEPIIKHKESDDQNCKISVLLKEGEDNKSENEDLNICTSKEGLVSEQNKQDSIVNLTENSSKFQVFKTATGRNIGVSAESVDEAKKLWGESLQYENKAGALNENNGKVSNESHMNETENHIILQEFLNDDGFQSQVIKEESEVNIVMAMTVNQECTHKAAEQSNYDHNSKNNLEKQCSALFQPFKSASGKDISVSISALEKVKSFWDDTYENNSAENSKTVGNISKNMKSQYTNNKDNPSSFTSTSATSTGLSGVFQTASGRNISISETALEKARQTLKGDNSPERDNAEERNGYSENSTSLLPSSLVDFSNRSNKGVDISCDQGHQPLLCKNLQGEKGPALACQLQNINEKSDSLLEQQKNVINSQLFDRIDQCEGKLGKSNSSMDNTGDKSLAPYSLVSPFQSASGKSISVSKSALKMARESLHADEMMERNDGPISKVLENHNSEITSDINCRTNNMLHESDNDIPDRHHNYQALVMTKKINKEQALLQSVSSDQDLAKTKGDNFSSPFMTASGSNVKVSKDAMQHILLAKNQSTSSADSGIEKEKAVKVKEAVNYDDFVVPDGFFDDIEMTQDKSIDPRKISDSNIDQKGRGVKAFTTGPESVLQDRQVESFNPRPVHCYSLNSKYQRQPLTSGPSLQSCALDHTKKSSFTTPYRKCDPSKNNTSSSTDEGCTSGEQCTKKIQPVFIPTYPTSQVTTALDNGQRATTSQVTTASDNGQRATTSQVTTASDNGQRATTSQVTTASDNGQRATTSQVTTASDNGQRATTSQVTTASEHNTHITTTGKANHRGTDRGGHKETHQNINKCVTTSQSNNLIEKQESSHANCSDKESLAAANENLRMKKLADARQKQEEIIQAKSKVKVKPVMGRLYQLKSTQNNRLRIKDVIVKACHSLRGNLKKQCVEGCVAKSVIGVTSANALQFTFDLRDYYGSDITHVYIGDGAFLVPNDKGKAGKIEFYRAFLTLDGVDPKLINESWFSNHYRWVVWKLAAYEVNSYDQFGGRALTSEFVMLQMKYRYDREIDRCHRSCLKKIMERDDAPCKRMVLCVSNIQQHTVTKVSDENVTKVNDKNITKISDKNVTKVSDTNVTKVSNKNEQVSKDWGTEVSVEVTDGWYNISAKLDPPLVDLIQKGKLDIGHKICVSGSEIIGSQDACSPLEAPSSLMLKICGNSTRPAPWDSLMGFQRDPRPLCIPLSSVNGSGGVVGCLDVIVARKYPLMFMEKLQDSVCVFRTEEAEEKQRRQHEQKQQDMMEKLYRKMEEEFDKEDIEEKLIIKKSWNRKEIDQLRTGQELYEALRTSVQEDILQDYMDDQQLMMLMEYRRQVQDGKRQMLQNKFHQTWTDNQQNSTKRNVIPLLKVKVVGCCKKDIDNKVSSVITVWKPGSEIMELKEGSRYKIFGLTASCSRSKYTNYTVQLTASRQTKFVQVPIDENLLDLIYEPREVLSVSELRSRCGFLGEADFVGLVVQVSLADENSKRLCDTVHALDCKGELLGIRFWGGLKVFGLSVSLVEGKLLCASNLMDKLQYRSTILPLLDASSEFTVITNNPQNSIQRRAVESLQYIIKSKGLQQCVGEGKQKLEEVLERKRNGQLKKTPEKQHYTHHHPYIDKTPTTSTIYGSSSLGTDSSNQSMYQCKMGQLLTYGSPSPLLPLSSPSNISSLSRDFKPPSMSKK